jgi:hypothetical protein
MVGPLHFTTLTNPEQASQDIIEQSIPKTIPPGLHPSGIVSFH